jgi:hypothetical protein
MEKKPVMIRMSSEEKTQGEVQAARLNLNLSEYIRLIIALDSATWIINSIDKVKPILDDFEQSER